MEHTLTKNKPVDLSKNENSLGPNPKVIARLPDLARELSKYPCLFGQELIRTLSSMHGVNPDQIVVGNGSVEILELAIRAGVNHRDEVIIPDITFVAIPQILNKVDAQQVVVPLKNWMIDLEGMRAAITRWTRMIVIVNPNNPTGTILPWSELSRFIQSLPPQIMVIIDEAYLDFVEDEYPGAIPLMNAQENLLVTRTFSKAHGLASLRIGYCVTNKEYADRIRSYRNPFSNNTVALFAAGISAVDGDYLSHVREMNRIGLRQLSMGLDALGISYIPSVTNFLTLELGDDAGAIHRELVERHILVAPLCFCGMHRFLRVTVGLPEENEQFLVALAAILTKRGHLLPVQKLSIADEV